MICNCGSCWDGVATCSLQESISCVGQAIQTVSKLPASLAELWKEGHKAHPALADVFEQFAATDQPLCPSAEARINSGCVVEGLERDCGTEGGLRDESLLKVKKQSVQISADSTVLWAPENLPELQLPFWPNLQYHLLFCCVASMLASPCRLNNRCQIQGFGLN